MKADDSRAEAAAGQAETEANPPKARRRRGKAEPPPYLAAELGQPVDQEGEPVGAGTEILRSDTALLEYTLRLWRQTQSGSVVNRHVVAMERAGLTLDDIWAAGVTDTLSSSSSRDEVQRFRQKLLFRANFLEAILSETITDLNRLENIEPAAPAKVKRPARAKTA